MARFCDKREVSKNTMFDAARFRNEPVAQSLCDRKLSNKISQASVCTWSSAASFAAHRGNAELEPFWVIPQDSSPAPPPRPHGVCRDLTGQ